METTIEAIEERVKRGAKLLDGREPDWYKWIDKERLDIRSTCNCLLGQMYGSFAKGLTQTVPLQGCSFEYGFNTYEINPNNNSEEFETLRKLWIAEINERLERNKS